MTVVTAQNLTRLRSRPQRANWHLMVYKPPQVFAAVVNDVLAAAGSSTITFTQTDGSYTAIVAGMTLYVGSRAGLYDVGRLRVRSATATTVTVAENTDVVWANGLYITVVNFHEPWPMYPNIVLDAAFVPTFYKDTDIAYASQNAVMDPIPMMGPNRGKIIDSTTGLATLYFDASDSYDLNAGGSITGYVWTFEGATVTSSTSATPGNIHYVVPGNYTVTLTVTNNLGQTTVAYRHVCIRTGYGGSMPPILAWGTDNLSGDYSSGGWSGQMWLRQDSSETQIIDGALLMIVSDDYYNGELISIGGSYTYDSKLVFVGYVQDGTVDIDPFTSVVRFDITNLTQRLDIAEQFGVSARYAAVATHWYEIPNLTVDIGVYHYVRWHSTIYQIADVQKNGSIALVQYTDFSRQSVRAAIDGWLFSTIMAHFCVDRQGKCWTETMIDMVPLASRSINTTLELVRQDWKDNLAIKVARLPKASYCEVGGIYFDGTNFTAIISSAPGTSPKYKGRNEPMVNGLVAESQTQMNTLAGNYLASKNKTYSISLELSGDYRVFDIAPQERTLVTITPDESYMQLQWQNKSFIPRTVSVAFDREQQTCMTSVEMEEETDGPTGVTGPYPPTSTDDASNIDYTLPSFGFTVPAPYVVPAAGPVPASSSKLVYVANTSKVGRTRTFLDASPTYENVTGAITGTVADFAVDPYDPKNKACVVSSTGIWITSTLNSATPTWISAQTAAQFAIATGKTLSGFVGVRYTITGQNVIYVQALATDGTLYIYCTLNNGVSWTKKSIAVASLTKPLGFQVSQHVAGRVWTSTDSGKLYYSSNATAAVPTYALLFTVSGANDPIANILIPYNNNSSDLILWIGGSGNSTPVARYDSNAGWSTVSKSALVGYYTAIGAKVNAWCVVSDARPIWDGVFTTPYGAVTDAGIEFTTSGADPETVVIDLGVIQPIGATISIFTTGNESSSWGGRIRFSVDGITWTGYSPLTFTKCSPPVGSTFAIAGYRYIEGFNGSAARATDFYYGYVTDGEMPGSPYVKKSVNGGASFSDVTPSSKGALGFRGIGEYTQDVSRIMALVGTSAVSTRDLVETQNSGVSWSIKQSGLVLPVGIGRWPYATTGVYFMQSTVINYSADGGVTILNKNGNWATIMGSAFGNPVQIIPIWVE